MKVEKLGNLVSITGGGTPERSNPSFWGGDVPWVTVKDFKSLEITGATEHITKAGLEGSASNLIQAGAIIVPTRMALGKAAINTVPVAINQDLKALRVKDASVVDRDFLFRFLLSKSAYLESQGKGATVKGITLDVLRELEVPLPPRKEQQRIATILNKVDSLCRKRQEAICLADDLLSSVFIDMFGVPGASSKWPESSVANMVSGIESGWSAPSSDRDLSDQELAVLKVSAVSTGWFLPDEAKPVDREMVDRKLVFPRRGDLLFSRANTRELVAACCLVEEDVDNRFLPDKLWRITADPKQATNEYLCYLFRHPAFRHELTKQATGTSGSMLNISQAKLLGTPAPLPPIGLQQKFTNIVNRSQVARRNSLNSLRDLQSLKESLTAKLFG